jgi:hypothetical protein
MISSGRPDCTDRFEHGKHRLQVRELLFVDQDVRVFEFDRHLVRVGDEVGAEVAAVELHAFDDVELGFEPLASSTVMTPSLPTFSIASAMYSPTSGRHWPR